MSEKIALPPVPASATADMRAFLRSVRDAAYTAQLAGVEAQRKLDAALAKLKALETRLAALEA